MEPVTLAMIAATALQYVSSQQAAKTQQDALEQQAKFRAMAIEVNRKVSDYQAREALSAGQKASYKLKTYQDKMLAAQQLSLIAQGVSPTMGTALALQKETVMLSNLDIQTAQNNAWREAWGYRMQAEQLGLEGRLSQMATATQIAGIQSQATLQGISYGLQGLQIYQQNKPQPTRTNQGTNVGYWNNMINSTNTGTFYNV